jgi:hypothetical protein
MLKKKSLNLFTIFIILISGCATKWQTYSLIYLGSAVGYIFYGGDKVGKFLVLKYLNVEYETISIDNDNYSLQMQGILSSDLLIKLQIEIENKTDVLLKVHPFDFIVNSDDYTVKDLSLIDVNYFDYDYSSTDYVNYIEISPQIKKSFIFEVAGTFLQSDSEFLHITLSNHLYDHEVIIEIDTDDISFE